MTLFLQNLALSVPLFVLVFIGYALVRWAGWSKAVADALSRFVFSVALPALLFDLMSRLSQLPPVDARLLIAFFGSCLLVFGIGRLVAWKCFKLDGTAQSVFALGGVFSNNVLLGVPLARATLGEEALPSVSLVLVFNALTLWTLVTASVEWSRSGSLSLGGIGKTAKGVLTNPIVAAILLGTAFGLTGLELPTLLRTPLQMTAQAAAPMALVALGMGLATYGFRAGLDQSLAITALKLIVQPLVVWGLAWALGLPAMETRVVVMLASLAVGANVYLMSQQFRSLEGPVASSLVISTALAALTTPLFLTLTA